MLEPLFSVTAVLVVAEIQHDEDVLKQLLTLGNVFCSSGRVRYCLNSWGEPLLHPRLHKSAIQDWWSHQEVYLPLCTNGFVAGKEPR